jgi:hypothetical protein
MSDDFNFDFDSHDDILNQEFSENEENFSEGMSADMFSPNTEMNPLSGDSRFDFGDSEENLTAEHPHSGEFSQEENPDHESETAENNADKISFGSGHRGACRSCTHCPQFQPSPYDYTGRTCVCGCSYYFHD